VSVIYQPSNCIVYDPNTQLIYASVPASGSTGNSIVPVDPYTGNIGAGTFVGSNPGEEILTTDGQYIYVVLDGVNVRRYVVASQSADIQWFVGAQLAVECMAPVPGSPHSIMVNLEYPEYSPHFAGAFVYVDGVQLPDNVQGFDQIVSDGNATWYAYENSITSFNFASLSVTADGVVGNWGISGLISGFSTSIAYSQGDIFTNNGEEVDPATKSVVGSFNASGIQLPSAYNNLVYFLNGSSLSAYDRNTFLLVASMTVNGFTGSPQYFIELGENGLAFNTNAGDIVVIQGFPSPVSAQPGVYAWGSNDAYQLGNGDNVEQTVVGQTNVPVKVTSVAAGGSDFGAFSLALNSNGTVSAWGSNYYGELGTNSTNTTPPYGIANASTVAGISDNGVLAGVTAIAAGNGYGLALLSGGSVVGWGSNVHGTLGWSPAPPFESLTPVTISGLSNITALSAARGADVGYYSLALDSSGNVWAWGYNANGQLGNGKNDSGTYPTPAQVQGISNATAVSAGAEHGLAVKSDGSVWAWGSNIYGQIGDGTSTTRTTAVQVVGPGGAETFSGAAAVAAGNGFSVALTTAGTVYTWGENNLGQLGTGAGPGQSAPVQVPGLSNITAIAAGDGYALALASNGIVWAWGDNSQGQLGAGSILTSPTPMPVSGLASASVIAAGPDHVLTVAPYSQPISGTVSLQGLVSDAEPREVQFQFRPTAGGGAVQGYYLISPSGSYTMYGVPNATYNAAIKGTVYLQTVTAVNNSSASPILDTSLLTGDVNGDNEIDIADFNELAASYGSVEGGTGYDVNADLNGDGEVDLIDFDLLATNYGLTGAP
jgi:alpha-tubulin suppressor-like RCC1 family protein